MFLPRFPLLRLPHRARILVWTLILWLSLPQRDGRAETALHYKYQSWQEDGGRIRVDAHYAEIEETWASGRSLRLVGLIDTIAGATPSGQPPQDGTEEVPLSFLEDRREGYNIDYTEVFAQGEIALGYGNSTESDYLSDVWSVNGQLFLNQKNTTLRLGYARADDDITAVFLAAPEKKTAHDAILGVTQVLSPRTVVTANLTYTLHEGFLSDPYKIIEKETEVVPGVVLGLTFPENRPDTKERLIGFFNVTHAFEDLRASLDASYRLLDDSWGVLSNTIELAWFQRLGERWVLRPAVRYYRQTEADFYVPDLNNSPIQPAGDPTGRAPYYSADYRLSEMETWMLGFKAVWEVTPALHVDATYERYLMHGLGNKTLASSYADADVFTVGIRLWF